MKKEREEMNEKKGKKEKESVSEKEREEMK